MTSAPTVPEYDPFAPDFYTSDPFGVYRWMRDEAPVYWSERYQWFALTRFEDVRAAALDADTFRSFEGMDIDDSRLEQVRRGRSAAWTTPGTTRSARSSSRTSCRAGSPSWRTASGTWYVS